MTAQMVQDVLMFKRKKMKWINGGRNRARTCDPLIKSQFRSVFRIKGLTAIAAFTAEPQAYLTSLHFPALPLTSRKSATNLLPTPGAAGPLTDNQRPPATKTGISKMARSKAKQAKQARQARRTKKAAPPQPIKVKLNKSGVEGIEPPATGERVVWDSQLTGFGVRVSYSGRRTYFVYARTIGGRQVKVKVGVHGQVTADQARDLAEIEIGKLMAGQDPAAERRQLRELERARRIAPTMNGLAEEYLTAHAEVHKRPSSVRDDRAILQKIVLPRLGSRPVTEITHSNIEALHRDLRATKYRANRTVALLSKMFSLSIKWGMRADNPAKGITRYQEEPRERYLRPDEIARLGDVLEKHAERPSANAVRLLLLTGARRNEVLSATWDQFDLDAGTWRKPSSHTKQKRVHVVPLSPQALALLAGIKAEADARASQTRRRAKKSGRITRRSPFVFPAGDGHLVDVKRFWASACAAAGIEGVRLHDLRHTYASTLASEKLSLPVIGALLGHSSPTTTSCYSHLLDAPLREATTAAAAKFDEYAKAPRRGKMVSVKP